ncbi:72 kDa inositol polyphosphate 5-phosphatase-like, partial [Paramuricea clavata]
MSEKVQGAITKQVFGESLDSLQGTKFDQSMPVGVNAEMLDKSVKSTDENSTENLKGAYFTPHPPEKPKDSNKKGPRRNKNKKRFSRRSNRVDLKSESSEDEKLYTNPEGLDHRTTGSKLPPLSKSIGNDFEARQNSETIDRAGINRPVDKNFGHVNPLTLNLKPLSPIKDNQKVVDNFKAKQSLERGKHELRERGPLKPYNPIERVSGLDDTNGRTNTGKVVNNLDSGNPTRPNNITNNEGNDVDDKSENTLTSVSSNDSSSDIDSDSQISPVNDTNIPNTQLSHKAPCDTPPAHHRHHHRSSLSLNSVRDYPQQVDRHSDTEAIRRGRAGNHQSNKAFWDKAKVVTLLPRVPADRARDRNSNFVKEELEKYLPERKLMVFVGTWNMHGEKQLPVFVDDFLLPECCKFMQDLYVIGSQESTPQRKEWEIKLQEALGPSHVLIYSCQFGVLHLAMYLRRELVWFCSGVEQATVATRPGHMIKTKGAIGLSLSIFGTSFLFINSHFTAHEQKCKERIGDYCLIRKTLSLPLNYPEPANHASDVTSRFNQVFWLGDFNFRVEERHGVVEKFLTQCEEDDDPNYEELVAKDQMTKLMKKNGVFEHFEEAKINFPPTYRFDINPDDPGHYSSVRVPSWT